MTNRIIDKLFDWGLAIVQWILTYSALSLRLRSKSGRENPRVAHVTQLMYLLHSYWTLQDNIDGWLANSGEIFPAIVQVQTINRCNAACEMCPYPYTVHLQQRQTMDDALYTKIVEQIVVEPAFKQLVPMSQNEALLDVRLEERITQFKQHAQPHHMVELVTNGSALTPARFEKLVKSGVDLLTISVSAFTESTYQKVMHGLSWKQVTHNLEAIADSPLLPKINIFLRYIQQTENEAEYPAFRRYWNKRGLNVLGFEINNRAGTVRNYRDLLPNKSFFLRRVRKGMGRRFFKGVCPHAFSIMQVLQNGDVTLCANDWLNREVMGNANQSSLRQIYNAPRFQEIRALMMEGRFEEIPACKDCSFWTDWLEGARTRKKPIAK